MHFTFRPSHDLFPVPTERDREDLFTVLESWTDGPTTRRILEVHSASNRYREKSSIGTECDCIDRLALRERFA
jgi:hypothetical protein